MEIKKETNHEKRLLVTEECPSGLSFLKDKQENSILEDGRRKMEWWLEDVNGKYHLAIIGVEGQSRDGHYTYTAQHPFSAVLPLTCKNRAGVFNWLEEWIAKESIEARPRTLSNWPKRQRKSRSIASEFGEDLSDASDKQKEMPLERPGHRSKPRITFKFGDSVVRAAQLKAAQAEDAAVQNPPDMSVIMALDNLQYEAEKEAAEKKNKVKLIINVVHTETSPKDVSHLQKWQNILEDLYFNWTVENRIFTTSDTQETSGERIASTTGTSYSRGEFYSKCIEAFSEISGMFIPIKLLAQSDIISFFKKFEDYPDANISKSAKDALKQWKEMTIKIAECAASGELMVDPGLKTENFITSSQYMQLHANHGTNRRRMDSYLGPMEDEEIAHDLNEAKQQQQQKLSDDMESEESIDLGSNAMIGRKYPREFYLKRIQESQPVYKFSEYAGMDPVTVEDASRFEMERESAASGTSGTDTENVFGSGKKAMLTEKIPEVKDETSPSQEALSSPEGRCEEGKKKETVTKLTNLSVKDEIGSKSVKGIKKAIVEASGGDGEMSKSKTSLKSVGEKAKGREGRLKSKSHGLSKKDERSVKSRSNSHSGSERSIESEYLKPRSGFIKKLQKRNSS